MQFSRIVPGRAEGGDPPADSASLRPISFHPVKNRNKAIGMVAGMLAAKGPKQPIPPPVPKEVEEDDEDEPADWWKRGEKPLGGPS